MVWADPGLLTRALFNLLENAVKYSPAGTVVSLSIRLEGDWLSCRIVDQGKVSRPPNYRACSASTSASLPPRAAPAWAWGWPWSRR